MGTSFLLLGSIALIIGIAIRYVIGRRKFNRRSSTGMQQFSSYEKAVGITLVERFFRFIGLLLILAGLFVIAFGWWYSKQEAHEQQIENVKPLN